MAAVIKRVIIVAYQEDTTELERALTDEGFDPIIVLRRRYSEEETCYSRASRCLLSHHTAWELASRSEGLSMIVEADFVPVKGIRNLPLPYPTSREDHAWGWLYACGQRVYELVDGAYIRGHSATTVAYVIGPQAAKKVMPFLESELTKNDPKNYFPWDIYIRMFAQRAGVSMYLPYRSYGEHGGIPNKEHKVHGITLTHHADVLWGPLHFLPLYAKGSRLRFIAYRLKAKGKAILRTLSGRYLERPTLFNEGLPRAYRATLLRLALTRHLSLF